MTEDGCLGLDPHWFGVYLDHLLPSTIPAFHSLPKRSASRSVWAGMGLRRGGADPSFLPLGRAVGGLGVSVSHHSLCTAPGCRVSFAVFPLSVHGSLRPPGERVAALTGTHRAGELSPWTSPWKMPFPLLTHNLRARSGHV